MSLPFRSDNAFDRDAPRNSQPSQTEPFLLAPGVPVDSFSEGTTSANQLLNERYGYGTADRQGWSV